METLSRKFEGPGLNAPPGHWTTKELMEYNRRRDRNGLIGAGLFAAGFLLYKAIEYYHAHGATIRPLMESLFK